MASSDPRLAFAGAVGDPLEVAYRKTAEVEQRVAAAESNRPVVQTGSGTPTGSPRDGTLYVDTTALKLYVRAGGAWHFANLT